MLIFGDSKVSKFNISEISIFLTEYILLIQIFMVYLWLLICNSNLLERPQYSKKVWYSTI